MNRQDYIAGDWVLSTSADYQNRVVQIVEIDRNGTIHAQDDGNEVILSQGEYEPIPMSVDWLETWVEEQAYHDVNRRRFHAPGEGFYKRSDLPFYISYYNRDGNFYAYTTCDFLTIVKYVHELQHLLFALHYTNIEIKKPKKK